jgi:hypothetical protein
MKMKDLTRSNTRATTIRMSLTTQSVRMSRVRAAAGQASISDHREETTIAAERVTAGLKMRCMQSLNNAVSRKPFSPSH